ncbi:hypothetical protein L5515_016298 [Caenorhabditis briggsae]|uniref:Uncharacterized protein n=1 Tax=Caenorhabditis briggsae TaxID=6238 RepID=A0AAE9JP50_CAEBR|nr:hypothetical protein L5515_016298 [Caenorhabditis briggsae]
MSEEVSCESNNQHDTSFFTMNFIGDSTGGKQRRYSSWAMLLNDSIFGMRSSTWKYAKSLIFDSFTLISHVTKSSFHIYKTVC